uniref:Uncharacterized protein n=1 Tax=Chromera velia CCMP2878 TaxID=1169474 RepID=A0A0G4HPT8_9ALVE|mmetsp:Transcript_12696/g.24739  ORF Transcript_12696/g.24739 Transcript_12696/m.24739 type:complete len:285 (-) Transcript_12696:1011-1865(-)|eukprot:Cvel_1238.t1-p1 / transcript=Cvel_1238.t1 / gene=Cvel_1238 / organism=Chromera_velia_CCMP2878 / gene_product=hypothetical protein / transcript_product=hypothetical protein / location=Cvel_scaffold41:99886-101336(+) / protein_length=284 / sequence_SO=supercontig / SO=protein_coding / is_pseudo=false
MQNINLAAQAQEAFGPKRFHCCKKCTDDIVIGPTCVADVCGGRSCKDCGYPASSPTYMKLSNIWGDIGAKTLPLCNGCAGSMDARKKLELTKVHKIMVETDRGSKHNSSMTACLGGCGQQVPTPVLRVKDDGSDGRHMTSVCISCASKKNKCQFCQKPVDKEVDPTAPQQEQAPVAEGDTWGNITKVAGQAFAAATDFTKKNVIKMETPHDAFTLRMMAVRAVLEERHRTPAVDHTAPVSPSGQGMMGMGMGMGMGQQQQPMVQGQYGHPGMPQQRSPKSWGCM